MGKITNEIRIYKAIKNRFVITFHHFFEKDGNFYLIFDLHRNGTLEKMIEARKRLHQVEVCYYMKQIISVLQYFRNNKILHRSICPQHILIGNNYEAKLTHFWDALKLENELDRKFSPTGRLEY